MLNRYNRLHESLFILNAFDHFADQARDREHID
jgi:hypothetical protein